MRKISKIGVATLGLAAVMTPMAGFVNPERASAACAVGWATDKDVSISMCNGENEDKTFVSKLAEDGTVTVTLNGYKGETLRAVTYGTGVELRKITFDLIGENEIEAVDGIALVTGATPVEFTGTGSLKIRSLVPMMTYPNYTTSDYQNMEITDLLKDYVSYYSDWGGAVTEVTIKPTVIEKTEEVAGETTDEAEEEVEDCQPATEATDEKKKSIPLNAATVTAGVAAAVYIILSLATFIILGIRKIARKHQPKEEKKIIIEEKTNKEPETTEEK